ncbi:MAG TPA: PAS domain S-box protein [Candidatus Polarisedimenticolia bacterium]|nr:PAS domain S-box protein [Candidatus Polarisedimenticolia bacterium]
MEEQEREERTAGTASGLDLYRALFRCSSDGILLLDPLSGRILEANAAAGLIAGRTAEGLTSFHLVDLAESQDAERVGEALSAARAQGSALLDLSLVRPPAGSRPVSVHLEQLAGGRLLAVVHDVAEKERLLQMVRREKEMSRGLLETVNACVLRVDLKGRATLLNRRFCETAGVQLSDILSKDAIEMLVVERDRPAARRALHAVIAGKPVEELDLGISAGGSERVLSFNGALVNDPDGTPVGVVWVAIDVTGTRRIMEKVSRDEERTQKSLQQLKEFSRVSSMILQEKDLDRVCKMFVEAIRDVSTFNRAILTLCDDEFRGYQWYFAGLSEKEIAVFHQNKLTSRERVTIFQERFRLGNSYYIPHDEGWYYEGVRSLRESEQMVDWHPDDFLFIPLFGSNRKIVGIVSVDDPADGRRPSAESISPLELFANQVAHAIEEKKLDREVKKTNERYRTLVETMNDALVTVDRRETITFVNQALLALTGHHEQEILGEPVSLIMAPAAAREFRQRTRLQEGGAGGRFELLLLAKGGEPIPVLVSATPYLEDGTVTGVFAVVSDLREQKKAEEERRRMHEEVLETNVKLRDSMQQLQAAQEQLIQAEKLSALGELISGVAHELNNPLTGVMGYAQLLMGSDASPEIKRNLERIGKEATRCQKIVQNLLAFARRHHPERTIADLNEVVRSTLDLRAYQLKVDNVEVIVELEEDLPPVLADTYQMQQVFINIINNAHHAIMETGRKGSLAIRTRERAGTVRVEFIDNGPGIAEDKIGKIFDPFFTTKEIGRGTGLGLSLSYGIVKEHEGHILVSSQPGKGATFVVELPAQPKEAAMAGTKETKRKPKPAPSRGRRILVVDDEETILELLLASLESSGHVVDTAGNGRQALEKLKAADYDVIISDLKMPDMGGQKLYESIGQVKPHLLPRMIFSTGDTVNPGTQSFFQRTGSPYLSKPFKLEEVDELVRKVLEAGEGAPPSPGRVSG